MSDKKIGWTPLSFDFSYEDEDDDNDEEIEFDEDDDDDFELIKVNLPKILVTPIGPFKIDDTLNPFRHYDFWMGSSNFNITKKVVKILTKIPGVEILNILSRYSFVIAVGKMFSFSDVRRDIESKLCNIKSTDTVSENPAIKNVLLDKYEKISKNKYWAIIVLPNGQTDEVVADSETDEFIEMLKLYKESRDNSNSVILCSHKELLEDGKTS